MRNRWPKRATRRKTSRRNVAIEKAPHPGPLPFRRGEGELTAASQRIGAAGDRTRPTLLFPLPIRWGQGQGEGFVSLQCSRLGRSVLPQLVVEPCAREGPVTFRRP